MGDVGVFTALCVLAAVGVLSRLISERAFSNLEDSVKLSVMKEFSGMRVWNLVPVVALIILLMAGNALFPGHENQVFGVFVAAVILYLVAMHRLIKRKMLNVRVPVSYLRTFLWARWLASMGLLVALAILFYSARF